MLVKRWQKIQESSCEAVAQKANDYSTVPDNKQQSF